MYSVYLLDYNSTPTADTPTPSKEKLYIYDPITYDEGLAVSEPVLSLEANKVGSFSCVIPPTNYGFGRIIKGLTRIVVEKDNKIKFMGRIFNEDRDLYLNQEIKAEGALGYLNDSLTDKRILIDLSLSELLNYIFDNHNSKFPNEPWKQFHLAVCEAKFVGYDESSIDSDKLSSYSINFDKSIELVLELVDLAKGALKIEYNETYGYWDVFVYDKNNLPVTSNQPIEFGVNLLDLIQTYDHNNIATAIAPFGGELIQTSKEIGEVIAGWDPDPISGGPINNAYASWWSDCVLARDNNTGEYGIYGFTGNTGYWVFELNIAEYNRQHPDNPLKRLYISWRAYKHSFGDGGNYVVDCAWRIDDTSNQNLAHHDLTKPNEQFESEINELIDLSEAQYIGSGRIRVGGWGMLLTPIIRRDAIIIDENDTLSITNCDSFTPDENGLYHPANSPYLYSENLINLYGLIEKRVDFNIEDRALPVEDWTLPYSANGHADFDFDTTGNGPLGAAKIIENSVLAYDITDGDERNEGNYQILPQTGDYNCIQYRLPELGDPNRPRGVYISARTHHLGEREYNGRYWRVNGLYAVYDTSWQVLAYKKVENEGFTSIKDEYIDLSAPAYYGAKWIRVASWGDAIPIAATPSDDTYARNRLMDSAKSYLTDDQWEKMTIEATAVDLNMTGKEWDEFDICTNVPVISEIHGMNTFMPLRALDIQLDKVENNVIKIGYDNDEYLSEQLSESSRLQSIGERRTS